MPGLLVWWSVVMNTCLGDCKRAAGLLTRFVALGVGRIEPPGTERIVTLLAFVGGAAMIVMLIRRSKCMAVLL